MAIRAAERASEGPIRLGMVGGGQGAFIGARASHRRAARRRVPAGRGRTVVRSGARQSLGRRARPRSRAQLRLVPGDGEGRGQARSDGIEAVAIVTPNHMHFGPAKAFLEAGIHVICDKPLTSSLADAKKLAAIVEKSGKVFVLTHNYTGYPMIRQAREMVEKGVLGKIRVVQAEYPQDWLTTNIEASGQKQAAWRVDPEEVRRRRLDRRHRHARLQSRALRQRAGARIRLPPISIPSSKAGSSTTTRNILLRFQGGAKGMIWASQVAPGNENGLKLRVYGEKGGLEWTQADPNYLWYTPFGEPKRLITRAGAGAGPAAARVTRVPSGHPEGYLEGFANIYAEAARAIRAARKKGGKPPKDVIFPTVQDGVEGVAFVEACVKSSKKNGAWTKL